MNNKERIFCRYSKLNKKLFKSTKEKNDLIILGIAIKASSLFKKLTDKELDYSIDSIGIMDKHLCALYKDKTLLDSMDNDMYNSICYAYGIYIGELLNGHYEGEWVMRNGGEPSLIFHLKNEDYEIFPITKVAKLLGNGEGESLTIFINSILDKIESKN